MKNKLFVASVLTGMLLVSLGIASADDRFVRFDDRNFKVFRIVDRDRFFDNRIAFVSTQPGFVRIGNDLFFDRNANALRIFDRNRLVVVDNNRFFDDRVVRFNDNLFDDHGRNRGRG